MDVAEISTTLELQRPGYQWFTKDVQVSYQKRKEGWAVLASAGSIRKAFREYGINSTIDYEPTYFPSLKAAQQAVSDVSLEVGLNIDSSLTRGDLVSYKIGDLPLRIRKNQGHWRVYSIFSSPLPQSLKDHFNSVEEFDAAWETANITRDHPTRKTAHQAVLNWLNQTITKK